ncbi:MAG: DUF2235 domain-containing protein [Acidobacteria bacterium]|nr:DUF2235 domain-containing protein [Acidobacteriota bacterium]
MALYAFDGTWNLHRKDTSKDTNVVWFRNAYQGTQIYQAGVGTRLGALGRVLGGITGAGGHTRVARAREALRLNFDAGDRVIDIVGFSRGAALALHFANSIATQDVPGHRRSAGASIRFLGLWDTVPSFGVPGNAVNIGWNLGLPDNVVACYHAMSLEERRPAFPLHRPDARVQHAQQKGRLFEVWFRGVHSDVGGGNANPGLSSIPLNWMYAMGLASGLPLDGGVIALNRQRMDRDRPISLPSKFDVKGAPFRIVRWNDQVHESVRYVDDPRRYNNPPVGLTVVDDRGAAFGTFRRA